MPFDVNGGPAPSQPSCSSRGLRPSRSSPSSRRRSMHLMWVYYMNVLWPQSVRAQKVHACTTATIRARTLDQAHACTFVIVDACTIPACSTCMYYGYSTRILYGQSTCMFYRHCTCKYYCRSYLHTLWP